MRISNEHERNTLKSAARRALALIGPAKQLAAVSRVSEGYLSKCLNRDLPDFLPLDVALEADRLAGAPVITSAMADMLGFRLVPVAGAEAQTFGAAEAFDLVSRAVALTESVRDADADGHRDMAERRTIANQIQAQIKALQDALRAVEDGGL